MVLILYRYNLEYDLRLMNSIIHPGKVFVYIDGSDKVEKYAQKDLGFFMRAQSVLSYHLFSVK